MSNGNDSLPNARRTVRKRMTTKRLYSGGDCCGLWLPIQILVWRVVRLRGKISLSTSLSNGRVEGSNWSLGVNGL